MNVRMNHHPLRPNDNNGRFGCICLMRLFPDRKAMVWILITLCFFMGQRQSLDMFLFSNDYYVSGIPPCVPQTKLDGENNATTFVSSSIATTNTSSSFPKEGVVWMWFSSSNKNNKNIGRMRETLASIWSVKANSKQDFHTTLLCDQTVYDFLQPLLLRNNNKTSRPTTTSPYHNLIDHIMVFNVTEFLEKQFPHDAVKPSSKAWKEKSLLGLLSPYEEKTLFLDVDVFVVSRTFVRTMMNLLERFDLIQPQVWALRSYPYTDTIPLGCSCIMAFNKKSPATRQVMEHWAKHSCLEDQEEEEEDKSNHKRIANRPSPNMLDQEILWWVIVNKSPANLKYFQLPMEYQCPLSQNLTDRWTYQTKERAFHKPPGAPFKELPCKVIHSHCIVNAVRDYYQCGGTGAGAASLQEQKLSKSLARRRVYQNVDICEMLATIDKLY